VEWAFGPFFVSEAFMGSAPDSLVELIRNSVESIGYELVGVEYRSGEKGGSLVRVYIDHADGINVDDCAKASHQISGVLDVEDPIRENYNLEVSSPGLDRPLFSPEHYERYQGSQVKVKLRTKLAGRRRFQGLLVGISEGQVLVNVDGEEYALPLEQIDSARLVPEF
jgi:ribosome maturation factor RimP